MLVNILGFSLRSTPPPPSKSTTPLRRNTRGESSTYAQDCAVREAVMLTLKGKKKAMVARCMQKRNYLFGLRLFVC